MAETIKIKDIDNDDLPPVNVDVTKKIDVNNLGLNNQNETLEALRVKLANAKGFMERHAIKKQIKELEKNNK